MPDERPRRPGTMSDDDRALGGRQRRAASAPVYVEPDDTGAYAVDDQEGIRRMRANRPTDKRLEVLEKKMDDVVPKLAAVDGKLDGLLEMTAAERDARIARETREAQDRERRRNLIVPIITALGIAVAGIIAAVH